MRYSRTSSVAAILVCLVGCATEVERPEDADDEAVLDHVEALGYGRASAEIDDEVVLVEGDIIFDRTLLLEGAYERTESVDGDLIEKGYRYPTVISTANQAKVKLAFATGKEAPSKAIRDGFIAAAKAWSAIPGSALRVSTSNTGPAITIRMVKVWKKPNTPCPDADACANAPAKGRSGINLYIRSGSHEGDCVGWSGSNLASVTRHEMGHALGFAHPKESGSKHVSGTKSCSRATEQACADDDNLYPTIMGPADIQAGCSVSPSRITQDDYATAKIVYPVTP